MPERTPEILPRPENAPQIEQGAETQLEQTIETSVEQSTPKKRGKKKTVRTQQIQRETSAPRALDPEIMEIESVLAEGMESFFLGLSPQRQMEFKAKGENTARHIRQALSKKTTRIKDIVRLIVNWLKTLPGINRFFLEQEAKIKADRIMHQRRP